MKGGCLATIVLVLVVALDIGAGFVAIQAQNAQQSEKHVRFLLIECKKPSQKAYQWGIGALGLFIVAILISHLNIPKHFLYIRAGCLIVIWAVGAAGIVCLWWGISSNKEGSSKCGITNKYFLTWGSKVCFGHAVISFIMYIFRLVL